MQQTLAWLQTQTYVKKRHQIGILGGNFNPVHNGHLLIADQVAQILSLDKVKLMPEAVPPHRNTKHTMHTISVKHRLNMIKLAIKGNPRLGIERIELQLGGMNYTFDTIKKLKKKNPDVDYFFIIGGDMVEYLPQWHQVEELMELVQFVGVGRLGYPKKSSFPVIWVDVPKIEVSSTYIRRSIGFDSIPKYLMPDEVYQYIQEKGLYLNGK
ncbi:MAG: nicotinate-nucleotide adenylyltransferase [Lactobacillales bacterium]|jgi:nicotinate-nucleotide adenylyltransferase|nr:nicotinate-nucleotide adenylyltransferase [Lactobacillales bacterium]